MTILDNYRKYIITALLSIFPVLLAMYILQPGSIWLLRFLLLAVVAVAGFKLDLNLALFPAIACVVADYLYLWSSELVFKAQDPLLWIVFICLPYLISNFLEKRKDKKEHGVDDFGQNTPRKKQKKFEQVLSFQSRGAQSEDPRELVQGFITDFFNSYSGQLGFCNLLYFHVRAKKATLGYLINKCGEIKQHSSFSPDIGQGVGWVLRHGESLMIPGGQLDWRNLQYHNQPVELGYVWLEPVKYGGELIGILSLEWDKNQSPVEKEVTEFIKQVRQLMVLDYSVRRLVKNQKQLKLIEKFYEINPLSQDNYHGIIQRVLEIVGEFIPADNIDFFEPPADKLEKVTPPARRKLYEQCVSWVLQNKKMLKIKDLRSESLAGRRLDRFGQTDIKSILAGPLYAGEEIVGVLLLDHHEADFFTEDEERILSLLFKQLGQILKVATHIRLLKAQRSEGLRLFSLLEELSAGKDLFSSAEIFVDQLAKKLSVHGVAFYWWNNKRFELVHSKGPGNPSPTVELSDTLVRRLKNSGGAGELLNFPDVNHLDSYEAPLGVKSIITSGVFRGGKLRGFIVIFKETDQKLSTRVEKILDTVQKIGSERLSLLDRSDKWRKKAARDEMSSLPTFKKWNKELSECLRLNPDKLTIWHLEIPGFEEIGIRSGKKKLDSWLKSSSRLLTDSLPDAKICRAYGSVFYGFSDGSIEEVEKKLAGVCELLEKWEFPLGEWPSHPRFLSAVFSPPYPGPGKMIQAPTYSSSVEEEK